MATLVLTTVGTAIGGPIGGAIGAMLGQAVDRGVLFRPKGRQGPRLDDLRVQTSSYGSAIPRLYGTIRAAGTVIWATDLKEQRTRTGGGKGRPAATNYSYSASFAVLLSGRRIARVGRIWADGKLLRGSAGDWKTATGFRLHRGGEDEAVDPLIASAEGAGQAPACRGQACAVFEDMDLGPYGNRIPSLTFEVVADEGGAALDRLLADGCAGVRAEAGVVVPGLASGGDSARGMVEALAPLSPVRLFDDGPTLAPARESAVVIGAGDRVEGRGRSLRRTIEPDDRAPSSLAISYHDPERDYQAGLQRARRAGGNGREERLELAAVLGAGEARALAEAALERARRERGRMTLSLPWHFAGLVPGTVVGVEGVGGRWRIARSTLEAMVVTVELVRHGGGAAPALPASPGRPVGGVDVPHGPTRLVVFEMPAEGAGEGPVIAVAAAGASPGWRSASLLLDAGRGPLAAGATAAPAVIGRTLGALATGAAEVIDWATGVELLLANDAMTLEDADLEALAAGANLAAIGGELMQFARAEPLGGGRWRLRGLVRGRRGSAVRAHGDGTDFALAAAGTLAMLPLGGAAIGAAARVTAAGPGDAVEGVTEVVAAVGWTMRPPAPVALAAEAEGEDVMLRWTRRSRTGWRWIDGGDAPLGEARERYAVALIGADGVREEREVAEPRLRLGAVERAGLVSVAVRQIGDNGRSDPAVLTWREADR